MAEEFKNYIGGKWVPAKKGGTFDNLNPADTNDNVGKFPSCTKEDVEEAVRVAQEAYKSWRLVPAPKRAEVMFKAGQILIERKEELAKLMTREMGKVLKETRGDVQEAIDTAYYIAGEGRRLFGETTPSELPNKFAMTIRIPMGVVAVITPWNFPMAIPSWKIFPALVAGNTVVFKPASYTPASAAKFVEVFEQAGLPAGVLNIIYGAGQEVGDPLIHHPLVKLVSFTGSSDVGRSIASACGQMLKKCSMEMGGKNPILVMNDADLDLALEGAVWGAFGTTGQRCTAASRLILDEKIADKFVDMLVKRTERLKVGNGLDPMTEMGPCVSGAQRETVHRYVEIGKDEGCKLLLGGEPLKGGDFDRGFFYKPTIFDGVERSHTIFKEEIFGPVVGITRCKTVEEGIEIINDCKYGLSTSVYTKDIRNAMMAVRDIYAGITYINSSTIGAEVHLPFGGTNETGNGHREAGTTVMDIFTEWKTVYIDYSGKLQKAQGID